MKGGAIERSVERAVVAFTAACRDRGLSVTHQRLAIFEAVVASRSHPDADEIYRAVRRKYPTISRGTVYRTLETLCELGFVSDVNPVRGNARFEAALDPHHHLICLSCRTIIDLHDGSLDGLRVPARARQAGKGEAAGFEVTGYQIQFVGYCRNCRGRSDRPGASRPGKTGQEA